MRTDDAVYICKKGKVPVYMKVQVLHEDNLGLREANDPIACKTPTC